MNTPILETPPATPRLNYAAAAPAALQAMLTFQQAANRTGLEQPMLELVKLRVSQINGCALRRRLSHAGQRRRSRGHGAGNISSLAATGGGGDCHAPCLAGGSDHAPCSDELRSARKPREEYVGPWLPEPIVDRSVPAPDAKAELADSLGVAFLLMLEQLAPVECAVFLLREAFDYRCAEIARIVDKSEANCRQMASRAKTYLAQGDVESARPTPQTAEIVQRFMRATANGKLEDLLAVLTDDAVLYTDGGGRVRSALRPIESADHVGRFFLGVRDHGLAGAAVKRVRVNGDVGILLRRTDGVVSVTSFAFTGDRIRAIYIVSDPEKLRHVRFDEL